jgi:hypothetical protein
MLMQKMPGKGLCLPTSFAMALGVPVATLLDQVPDPYTVVFPGLPEPLCWRGLHVQELIRLAQNYGYGVTPREMYPQIAAPRRVGHENYIVTYNGNYESDSNQRFFADVIRFSQGVITGVRGSQIGHAVAYSYGDVYDPNGYEYAYEVCKAHDFFPQCAWRIQRT